MPSTDTITAGEGDAVDLGVELRVASYNVRSLRDDRAAVVSVVRAIAPDVLILQEAPRLWFWRTRCEAFARKCGMTIVAGGDGGSHGNLILVKPGLPAERPGALVVERARVLALPKTSGLHARAVVSATCRVEGELVTFVGFHLGMDAAERAEHVELILADIATLPGAVIAAGDVNETPEGPVWERFRTELVDTAGDDDTASFSTRSPRKRLDGVFVDRSARRWESHVWREPPVSRASDHFPVVARVWLPHREPKPELPNRDRSVPRDPDSAAD